ncbi:hypothetical protein AAHE18_13G147900 [Arachis hypogaea]
MGVDIVYFLAPKFKIQKRIQNRQPQLNITLKRNTWALSIQVLFPMVDEHLVELNLLNSAAATRQRRYPSPCKLTKFVVGDFIFINSSPSMDAAGMRLSFFLFFSFTKEKS